MTTKTTNFMRGLSYLGISFSMLAFSGSAHAKLIFQIGDIANGGQHVVDAGPDGTVGTADDVSSATVTLPVTVTSDVGAGDVLGGFGFPTQIVTNLAGDDTADGLNAAGDLPSNLAITSIGPAIAPFGSLTSTMVATDPNVDYDFIINHGPGIDASNQYTFTDTNPVTLFNMTFSVANGAMDGEVFDITTIQPQIFGGFLDVSVFEANNDQVTVSDFMLMPGQIVIVPEPGSIFLLFSASVVGLLAFRRRR